MKGSWGTGTRGERQRYGHAGQILAMLLILVLLATISGGAVAQSDKERIGWAIIDKATVVNSLDVFGTSSYAGVSAFDGGLTASTATLSGDVTVSPDATGGNAGAKSEISGLPRLWFASSAGVLHNGTTETTNYIDDSPAGEFAPINARTTELEPVDVYRMGTTSYECLFLATGVAGDGCKRTIAGDNLEADESIGFWAYPSVAIAAADLQILLTDDGGARNFDLPALTASKWTWVEIDITSLAAGTGDVVTEFGVTLTTQGAAALAAFNLFLDYGYKWDAADEVAIGADILTDGVLAVICMVDANTGVHTTVMGVEGTSYLVNYQASSDVIIPITDLSTYSCTIVAAY